MPLGGRRIAPMADNSGGNRARSGGDFADLAIMGVAGLTFALVAMFLCVAPLAGNIAGSRDFVTYWATGQQLIRHESPYDPANASLRA